MKALNMSLCRMWDKQYLGTYFNWPDYVYIFMPQ